MNQEQGQKDYGKLQPFTRDIKEQDVEQVEETTSEVSRGGRENTFD